jgi:hypothetical protein
MSMRNLRIVLLALLALAFAGLAAAQAEPTLAQIYQTAQSGQVDKARQMTEEVLRTHPGSAKAHFVLAELDASQGKLEQARDALSRAESLAPGLPFARPEAVQSLRAALGSSGAANPPAGRRTPATAAESAQRRPAPSFPWGIVVLAAVVIAAASLFMRSRNKRPAADDGTPGAPGRFGMAASGGWASQRAGEGPPPAYGSQAGYGGAPPVQPAPSGMGGNIMGGLATGLAVGAGALAAQEIGRRMLGEHGQQQGLGALPGAHPASESQLARDAGLGSLGGASGNGLPADFGIADGGSWDDPGAVDVGGVDEGGDWDS